MKSTKQTKPGFYTLNGKTYPLVSPVKKAPQVVRCKVTNRMVNSK